MIVYVTVLRKQPAMKYFKSEHAVHPVDLHNYQALITDILGSSLGILFDVFSIAVSDRPSDG